MFPNTNVIPSFSTEIHFHKLPPAGLIGLPVGRVYGAKVYHQSIACITEVNNKYQINMLLLCISKQCIVMLTFIARSVCCRLYEPAVIYNSRTRPLGRANISCWTELHCVIPSTLYLFVVDFIPEFGPSIRKLTSQLSWQKHPSQDDW